MSSQICCLNLLSEAECRSIIKKAFASSDVYVVSYEIVPASESTIGYLGDYYKLIVTIKRNQNDDKRTISFFIKSLPLQNDVHRAVITRLKFMNKETTLYGLFDKMKKYSSFKWHPDVYLYRDDVLVLEDLIESNFRHRKFNLDISVSSVWPVLKAMAAMHANSIVYETKTGTNIGIDFRHIFTRTITKGNTWVNSGLKSIFTLANIHPKFQTIEYQYFIGNHLAREIEKVHELGTISTKYRNTLCHRDLWESNIFFKEDIDDTSCVFVDFQITRYIPPAIDVCLFLHINANRTNRRENLQNYLNYYYNWLSKFTEEMDVNIEEQLPKNEFDKTCEEFKLIPLVLTCVYAPIIYLPDFKILRNLNKTDPVAFQYVMNGDRSDFALQYMNKYEDYSKRILEAVEELVEYLYEHRDL